MSEVTQPKTGVDGIDAEEVTTPQEWVVGIVNMRSRMSIGLVQANVAKNGNGTWQQSWNTGVQRVYVCMYVCMYVFAGQCCKEWEWHVAAIVEYMCAACVCVYVCMYVCICRPLLQRMGMAHGSNRGMQVWSVSMCVCTYNM